MINPNGKSLIKIAEDYHNKVCDDEVCIIYKKKEPLFKISLNVVGGIVNFQHSNGFIDRNYLQTGILTDVGMPGVNEKLFFRTGVLYSALESGEEKYVVYKIPLQVGYIYPKGIVRPSLAYGINIYQPFYQSVAFMGGLNFRLHPSFYWAVYYDIDFEPREKIPFFPQTTLSQSFLTGLQIRF